MIICISKLYDPSRASNHNKRITTILEDNYRNKISLLRVQQIYGLSDPWVHDPGPQVHLVPAHFQPICAYVSSLHDLLRNFVPNEEGEPFLEMG